MSFYLGKNIVNPYGGIKVLNESDPADIEQIRKNKEELEDARTDVDGKTHSSVGEAIRGQISSLKDSLEQIDAISEDEMVELTKAEYDTLVNTGTIDENKYYFITDDESEHISNWYGFFTLEVNSNWDLILYYTNESTPPLFSYDSLTRNLYWEIPNE